MEQPQTKSARALGTLAEQLAAIVYAEAMDEEDGPAREVLYVSPRIEDVLGYPPEDWLANPGLLEERLHPEDRARVLTERARARETGEPLKIEYRFLARDGESAWIRDEAVLVRDEAGTPLHWRGVQYDVTERKRSQEESRLLQILALEVAGAEDLDSALGVALRRVCEATGWAMGQAWIPKADGTVLECGTAWYAKAAGLAGFRAENEGLVFEPGAGLPGRAWSSKRPAWTKDITRSGFPRARVAARFGLKAGAAVPVLAGSEVVVVLDFFLFEERREDQRLVTLVSAVAAQLGSIIRRKEAEEALRESEARSRAIVNTASDAIISMSKDGIVRSFNPAAERIFGYDAREILGRPLKMLMPERFRKMHEVGFRSYLDTGEAHVMGKGPVELAGLRKSGEEFPLKLSLGEMRTGDDVMFTGVIRDITERHRVKNALRVTEERFRHLVKQATDAFFVHDLEGRFVDVNQQACESLGYTQEELLNLSVADVEENFDPETLLRVWERVVAEGPLAVDGIHRRKDGTRFPVEVRIGPLETAESRLILGLARDVTERKRAEEALRESEANLAQAQRIAHLGSWETHLTTGQMRWSEEMYRILGFAPGEVAPTREVLERSTHPQDREAVSKAIRGAAGKRQPFDIDHRVLRPGGEVRFVRVQGEAVFDGSGRPSKIVGTSLDITERKRIEEELRRSESKLLAAQRIAHVGNWSFEVTGNEAHWSDEIYRIFGLVPREPFLTYKQFLRLVHPDDRRLVQEASREALEGGGGSSIDYRLVRPDGEVRSVHGEYEVEHDASGRVVALHGTLQDVTGLRRAEAKLREQARVLDLAPVLVRNLNDEITLWSAGTEKMYGWSIEEAVGRVVHGLLQTVHPEPLSKIEDKLLRDERWEGELVHTRKDGTTIVVASLQVLHRDERGEPAAILEVNNNVTERKRVEETLARSEERYRRLVELSPEAVIVHGEGKVLYSNPATARLVGAVSPKELVGRPIMGLAHPDYREAAARRIREAFATGKTIPLEEEKIVRLDGGVADVEVTGVPIVYEGKPAIQLLARDITERKRAEEALRRSDRRTTEIVESIADPFFSLDREWRFTYLNPQAEALLRRTQEELLDKNVWEEFPEALGSEFDVKYHEAVDTRSVVEFEESYTPLDTWLHVRAYPTTDGLYIYFRDITEQKRAEESLRRSEERFRSLFRNASDVVAIIGADGITHYVSPPVERVLGYEPDELIGTNGLSRVHPDDAERVRGLLARILGGPGNEVGAELRLRHADGSWRHVEVVGKNLIDDPSIGGIVVNYRDVTERKAFEEQLEHRAFHDDLTDLPNRALFTDRLEHALAGLGRSEGGAVAVLFVDLDDFKVVNDSLGHAAGDALLVSVAGRLRSRMRPEDTLARFGGDEFAVLLEDVEGASDAERVAERILEELRAPLDLWGREVFVSPSVGISLATTASDRAEDLLRNADTALYRAKALGKGRHAVFDSRMHAAALKRLRTESDLRRALERGELRVRYQPKMRLLGAPQRSPRSSQSQPVVAGKRENKGSPRIVGTEALVRWEHPDEGLILPAEFVPVAEETGLIVPVGRWVLREACLQTRRWNDEYPADEPFTVCVNLSARQFQDPGLRGDVARILQETGLDPRCLSLEITKSVVMEDAQGTINTLRELKGLGVEIAVDDFGTGYSSLAYLKRFPVDYLKIDRSFVEELKGGAGDATLVSGIIRLAHTLGMRTVAEGVESAKQLELLLESGCDLAQGYYFAKPLPAEAVPGLLAHARQG